MDLKEYIRKYLGERRIMQLATQNSEGQLWACTVHFYSDDDLNLYWVSNVSREHSTQIAQNPEVAVALVVHEDEPVERYVIGISMSGTAQAMDSVDADLADKYIAKLNKDPELIAKMKTSTTHDKFYKFTPRRIVMLDSKNFPDNPRQELTL